MRPPSAKHKGRGTALAMEGRFESLGREWFDDGWASEEGEPARPKTIVREEIARTIISRNDSPDIGFDQSINPYRGCEHGCVYCYARPTHAYINLSPGIDFETKLFVKPNAAELLRKELAAPGYVCKTIVLGANTDPYQPIERRWRITRSVLEVLAECEHPVGIVTKSANVLRDLDLLAPMAKKNLVNVFLSVTTLDHDLARKLEPRASAPARRIEAIGELARAGVRTGVLVAPIIPQLTDHDLERVLERAAAAGAQVAGYTIVRLPYEIKDLFRDWLVQHYADRSKHVMSIIRDVRGGRDNDANFGTRMHGTGHYAQLIADRFRLATQRLGYTRERHTLDKSRFRAPSIRDANQLDLF